MLEQIPVYSDLNVSLIALVLGYLLGSISFGIILPKLQSGNDIRKLGSGNAGTTNVLRTQGKKMALIVLIGDLCKGLFGAWLGFQLAGSLGAALGSLGTIVGHCYPIYFGLKGGKGIATGIGTILMIEPIAGILALVVFAIVVAKTRFVSLGSILGAGSLLISIWFFNLDLPLILYSLAAVTFVIFRHRINITKLMNGTEVKLGQLHGGIEHE